MLVISRALKSFFAGDEFCRIQDIVDATHSPIKKRLIVIKSHKCI